MPAAWSGSSPKDFDLPSTPVRRPVRPIGSSLPDGKNWEKNRFRAENPPSHCQKPPVNQTVMNHLPTRPSREPICLEQGAESVWQGRQQGERASALRTICLLP
jgi:hypothetical protein